MIMIIDGLKWQKKNPQTSRLLNLYLLIVGSTKLLKTVGKGEITRNEQFLFFFLTVLGKFQPFLSNLELFSANSFSLEQSKICRLGKG